MNEPTLQILQNPDQALRYFKALVATVRRLEEQNAALAAQIAVAPTPVQPGTWLRNNGQEALSSLSLDLSSQAQTTVADVPPTATDDETKGYKHFSRWIDSTTGILYNCVDPSAGAAVWV